MAGLELRFRHEVTDPDTPGSGLPDIVGKPYYPRRHIDVWFNET